MCSVSLTFCTASYVTPRFFLPWIVRDDDVIYAHLNGTLRQKSCVKLRKTFSTSQELCQSPASKSKKILKVQLQLPTIFLKKHWSGIMTQTRVGSSFCWRKGGKIFRTSMAFSFRSQVDSRFTGRRVVSRQHRYELNSHFIYISKNLMSPILIAFNLEVCPAMPK